MNYSNSQRAGVILYLTALLFGGYFKAAVPAVGKIFPAEQVQQLFDVFPGLHLLQDIGTEQIGITALFQGQRGAQGAVIGLTVKIIHTVLSPSA